MLLNWAALPASILDAELVATDKTGKANFGTLRRTLSKRQEAGLAPFAFDLLYPRGRHVGGVPYIERKARLANLVAGAGIEALYHSGHFSNGNLLLAECERRGLEGIVTKRRGRIGLASRRAWVEVKNQAWREANRQSHLPCAFPHG